MWQQHKSKLLLEVLRDWSRVAALEREKREVIDSMRRALSPPQSQAAQAMSKGTLKRESRQRPPASDLGPSHRHRARSPPIDTAVSDSKWKAVRLGLRQLSNGGLTPLSAVVWTEPAPDGFGETYSLRKMELHSEDLGVAQKRSRVMKAEYPHRVSVRAVRVPKGKPGELNGYGVGLEELGRAVQVALREAASGTSSDSSHFSLARSRARPAQSRGHPNGLDQTRRPASTKRGRSRKPASGSGMPPTEPSSSNDSSEPESQSAGGLSSRCRSSSDEEAPALRSIRAELQLANSAHQEQLARTDKKTLELQSMLAQATESLSQLRSEQRASDALRAVEARRQEEHVDERRAADSQHFRELMEQELREQANRFQEMISNLEAAKSQALSPVEGTPVSVPLDQGGQVQPVGQEPRSVTTMDVGTGTPELSPKHSNGEPHQWDYLSVSIDAVSEVKEQLEALDPTEAITYEDFRAASRSFRVHLAEAGLAGCKPPKPGSTWAKRHKVVVTGPLKELGTAAGHGPCARCSRESRCHLWSCWTVSKDSGEREQAYLPLCKFCTACTWSGAWEDFPAVRPPPPPQPCGPSSVGGGDRANPVK